MNKYTLKIGLLEYPFNTLTEMGMFFDYLDIEWEEANLAIAELVKRKHNTAHFGIHKTFMFTDNE